MYASMKQAYQFSWTTTTTPRTFSSRRSRTVSVGVLRIQHVDRDNQSLETELGRLEVQKQDLDDEVSDLVNVGKEIPQAGFLRRPH